MSSVEDYAAIVLAAREPEKPTGELAKWWDAFPTDVDEVLDQIA